MNIKTDLGTVPLYDDLVGINHYSEIKKYMKFKGFNTEYCDVCSVVKGEVTNNKVELFFKFVHYTVPSMETETYYRIEFITT